MKTFATLTVVFCILLFGCSVWAQNRPLCPIDPATGWTVLPDPPGACFVDTGTAPGYLYGMLAFVWDGTQFVYAFSANKGNNDFFRYNPQGKGLFHNQDKDGVTAYYCSDWDMESMTCNTALFAGPARLTAIGSSDNAIIYDCPFSIRVTGLLADLAGTGDQVDVQAHWRYVQNQDECREAMVKIEADPIE